MESPKSLQQAILYFSDEQRCIDTLARLRWPDGVQCPACLTKGAWWLKTQKRFKCKECRRQFSVKLDTIFEDSGLPLQTWMPALWMLCNCKNGVSSHEIARALKVTQKSAWFMLHRLRLAMKGYDLGTKLGGQGSGFLEADETFIGGQLKNMHKDKKLRYVKRGGTHGKTIVMGVLDREAGKVHAEIIPDTTKESLHGMLQSRVKFGSTICTDDAMGYIGLRWKFTHEVINKMVEGYVKGQVHTQGIENFWALLKRGLGGTYISVEPFHLDRYIDEQVFRYNNRKKPMDDNARFEKALSQVAHKRLTYAELTNKVGETAAF